MAVVCKWYGLAHAKAWGGVTESETTYFIDWLSDTVNVMLATAYTANQDTHSFKGDLGATEVSNACYTARGKALASKTLAASSNTVTFDAADTSWTSCTTLSASYAIIYKDSGTDSTSPLMGWVDFGGAQANSGTGTWKITWAAAGIFTITVS